LEGLHPFVSGWIFFALSSMLATGARVLHFRLSARLVLSSLPLFALFRIEQSWVQSDMEWGGKEKKFHQPIIIIRGRTTQRISIDNKLKPPFHFCSYLFLC
jgi:hypothetical protein